jgi:hypothetical protein
LLFTTPNCACTRFTCCCNLGSVFYCNLCAIFCASCVHVPIFSMAQELQNCSPRDLYCNDVKKET